MPPANRLPPETVALPADLDVPTTTPGSWVERRPFHRQDSDGEWLTLAQHHGLPTRVLDWTCSSLDLLRAALKPLVREHLDQANTTERVLFPGLDGSSRWLTRCCSSPPRG